MTEKCIVDTNKTSQIFLKKFLAQLNCRERKAIYLRFWVPYSIEEVAREMEVSWEQANQLIESSIAKLREDFRQKGFAVGQSPAFLGKEENEEI